MLDLRFGHYIGVTLSKEKWIKLWKSIIKQPNIEGKIERNIFLKKDSSQHVLNLLTQRPLTHDWNNPTKKSEEKIWRSIPNKLNVEG